SPLTRGLRKAATAFACSSTSAYVRTRRCGRPAPGGTSMAGRLGQRVAVRSKNWCRKTGSTTPRSAASVAGRARRLIEVQSPQLHNKRIGISRNRLTGGPAVNQRGQTRDYYARKRWSGSSRSAVPKLGRRWPLVEGDLQRLTAHRQILATRA